MKKYQSAILLLFISLFFSFEGKTQTPNENNPTVRILTFNILHGATTKGNFDLDKISSVIQQTDKAKQFVTRLHQTIARC